MSEDKCGIYQILCRANGKVYVGSSRNIYNRWTRHRSLLRLGKNGCWKLQKSWTKHGEAAFTFSVLEECVPEELDAKEQLWIDELKPALNVIVDIKVGAVALAIAANKIRYAAITHCPRGHLYDEANTYIGKKGERICRACNAERVSAIYAAETAEEREKRRAAVKASREKNLAVRLAKQREYALANKAAKAENDRQHRAEQTARKREAIRNHTPEEHRAYLERKRRAYHRSKGRGDVDTWERPPISEEQKAKISKTLRERDRPPPNEPWIAEGISKSGWYRRLKRQTETPEQRELRNADKRARYHANGDKEREKMRLRYRRSREELPL